MSVFEVSNKITHFSIFRALCEHWTASFLAVLCSEITAQKVRGCRRLLLSLNYNVVGTYTYLPSDGLDHLIRNTRIEETGWGAAFSKKVAEILFAECDPTQIISYNTQNSNFIWRELIGVYTHCSSR